MRSAWSQPFPSPSRGRADCATLGRRRRTRRPVLRDAKAAATSPQVKKGVARETHPSNPEETLRLARLHSLAQGDMFWGTAIVRSG